MLFDVDYISESTNYDNVEPCKYEANLEGALMLVYENECNYNALMKAAALSEFKYYKENGTDLFVQEAGAMGGFIEKAKSFFKKVIEKIKSIFKKFFMTITSYIQDDKTWVKKYEKDIYRATHLDNFTFKGYKFDKLDAAVSKIESELSKGKFGMEDITLGDTYGNQKDEYARRSADQYSNFYDKDKYQDDIDKWKEMNRGNLLGDGNEYTEAEFREELKDALYGDDGKTTLDDSDINLREQLEYIRTAKKNIEHAEKMERNSVSAINKIIKALETKQKEVNKFDKAERDDPDGAEISKTKNDANKVINGAITIYKSLSNDITVACGMVCQALKDRNRQAKAICIKAVSYSNKHKNESAVYTGSDDDLFASVTIR
jgi:hypothetical protein